MKRTNRGEILSILHLLLGDNPAFSSTGELVDHALPVLMKKPALREHLAREGLRQFAREVMRRGVDHDNRQGNLELQDTYEIDGKRVKTSDMNAAMARRAAARLREQGTSLLAHANALEQYARKLEAQAVSV